MSKRRLLRNEIEIRNIFKINNKTYKIKIQDRTEWSQIIKLEVKEQN